MVYLAHLLLVSSCSVFKLVERAETLCYKQNFPYLLKQQRQQIKPPIQNEKFTQNILQAYFLFQYYSLGGTTIKLGLCWRQWQATSPE